VHRAYYSCDPRRPGLRFRLCHSRFEVDFDCAGPVAGHEAMTHGRFFPPRVA
jgi:hypothetical protein